MAPALEWLCNRLLATSVQTVVMVALVWLLCRCVRRLPASTQCTLWWLVALQAVLGLVWASPVLLPVLPAVEMTAGVAASDVLLTAALPVATAVSVLPPAMDAAGSALSWHTALMVVWLAGVLLTGWRTLQGMLVTRALRRDARPCRDRRLQAALAAAVETRGLRRAPRLLISEAIRSPQLAGLWQPALLLPARELAGMDAEQRDMAITHELVHLQRHDLWLGLVPVLARHLFFFHPAVRLAHREYAIAREAAVDAAVVSGERHCRHRYAHLLVQLGVGDRPRAGLASASPTFLSLKRRLLMLQHTSPLPRMGTALILAAVAVAGVMPVRLVAQSAPPALPVPPAPESAPAVPPVNAPVLPPVPPAPAAHSVPPLPTVQSETDAQVSGYVLARGNHTLMQGNFEELHQAKALDQGNGVLVLRRDGKRYVVLDAAVLARFERIHADTLRLAEAQGALGDRQGQLGDRQGQLGEQQGAIGDKMGDIGERLGGLGEQLAVLVQRSGPAARRDEDAVRRKMTQAQAELDNPGLQAQMQELGDRQAELGKQQAELGKQQAELGKQQAELGRQMAAASAVAERETDALIREVIAAGTARPIEG